MDSLENVSSFMELFEKSSEVQQKYAEAEENYPGSLEIRENVVEEVLIPFARKLGFIFTLSDLRKFETRQLLDKHRDVEIDPSEPDDDRHFWLLEHGWTDDESKTAEMPLI